MSEDNKDEVIRVVHNEGEDKPWEVRFDDLGALKRARAILNYPVHKFETEEKAIEVAEMLRDIIKADAVDVEGEPGLRDDVEKAEFFHNVSAEGETRDDAAGLTERHDREPELVGAGVGTRTSPTALPHTPRDGVAIPPPHISP